VIVVSQEFRVRGRKPVTHGENSSTGSDTGHEGSCQVRAGRTAGRGAVALTLALWPLVGLAGTAHAETGTPQAVKTGWYWAEKTAITPVTTLPTLPDAANPASNVPDGDLGVGYLTDQLTTRDKSAAVDFDLTSIPTGALFSSFQVTVPVDGAANNLGTAAISACENIDTFSEALGPQDMAKAPPYATPTCVPGVLNAANAFVFDLTAVANEWSQGTPEQGISIVPTLLATTDMRPFSVALKGKNDISVKATWTPAPPQISDPGTTDPVLPPVPNVVAPPPIQSGGGGVLPTVPDVGAPQPVTVPQAPQPQANPVPEAVAITKAAYTPRTLVPSTVWWVAVLAVGGLLGLAYLTQSDPLVPVKVDPRRARFARAVRSA